jgi:hypothetical protein
MKNVVYESESIRPGISCDGSGSETMPVKIIGNYVFNSGMSGIGMQKGCVGIIEENMVVGSIMPGITVNGSTALRLNRNKVACTKEAPGVLIVNDGKVNEMLDNASDSNNGPRFAVSKKARLRREVQQD